MCENAKSDLLTISRFRHSSIISEISSFSLGRPEELSWSMSQYRADAIDGFKYSFVFSPLQLIYKSEDAAKNPSY